VSVTSRLRVSRGEDPGGSQDPPLRDEARRQWSYRVRRL